MTGVGNDINRFFDLVLDVSDAWRFERARDLAGWAGEAAAVGAVAIAVGVVRADVSDDGNSETVVAGSYDVTMALNGAAPQGWDDDDFDLARALPTCTCEDDVDWCSHAIAVALELIRIAEESPGLVGVWRQDPAGPTTWGAVSAEDRTTPTTEEPATAPVADEQAAPQPEADMPTDDDPWAQALSNRDTPDRPLGDWINDAFADTNESDWTRLHKTLTFCLHPDRRNGDDRWSRVLQETWTRLQM